MLSNGFDTTLHLKLKPSKILFKFRVAAHFLALCAILIPLSIYTEVKIILSIYILSSLILMVNKYLKTRDRERHFYWRESNQWIETGCEGDKVWLCLPGAMITAWFVMVPLVNENIKQTVFISADQCDKETYRRLIVRLKYLSLPVQEPEANSIDSN